METTVPPAAQVGRTDGSDPRRGRGGRLSGRGWIVGVWAVVVLFGAVTAWRSHQVGIPMRDPHGSLFLLRLPKALALLLVLALADAAVRSRLRGGVGGVLATLRARWPRHRVLLAVTGLVAYHAVYVCYRNMKSWNAFRQLRDAELLRADKWLFLGHDPAVLLHDLLGQHTATYVLMVVYKVFVYVVTFSVVASLVFVDRIRDGYVFVLAGMWAWVLAIVSYYALPSLGPYAEEPSVFAGLPHTTITSEQATYLVNRAALLADPSASGSFASLGAFASLHVGFTALVWLMLRWYGMRRLARVAAVYLVLVMVATVYLGWHYALDVVAGLLLAWLSVLFARWMIYPHGRPAEAPAGTGDPSAAVRG